MSILNNIVVVVCCFLAFAVTVNAANSGPVKSFVKVPSAKVAVSKKKAIELVNINSADVVTLQKVKGIGKKKSQAIIEYRKEKGPFNSIKDLLNISISGINQKWLDKVEGFLKV